VENDEELMLAAAGGDMEAFAELVRRHEKGALNVAFRLLSDEHRAQDVVQEAFLRVLQTAPRYRPSAKFRTYLYRILTRICIDHYRRRKAQPSEDLAQVAGDGERPSEIIMRQERADSVRAAIEALPVRQRTALVLQHYEGLSYEEIAQALDCSVRAVDSLLVRAKANLKEQLARMM